MLCEYSWTVKQSLLYGYSTYIGLNRYIYDNGIIAILFMRFFTGVIWYRKFAKGNLSSETQTIYIIRVSYDCILLYPFIFFFHKSSDYDNDLLYISVVIMNLLLTWYLYFAGLKRAEKKEKEMPRDALKKRLLYGK